MKQDNFFIESFEPLCFTIENIGPFRESPYEVRKSALQYFLINVTKWTRKNYHIINNVLSHLYVSKR